MCDFTGNGKEMRAADAREKLAKLKQEEDVLQKGDSDKKQIIC